MLQKLIDFIDVNKGLKRSGPRPWPNPSRPRGKLDADSCISDSFSVTFFPIGFGKHVLGCQVRVKPTETCLFEGFAS